MFFWIKGRKENKKKIKGKKGKNGDGSEETTQVMLNVYDLTPVNNYTYWFGFGIFHSGIEVHGMEYGFGAHDFPSSGVFEVDPKSCPGFIYRCSVPLGRTSMPREEFRTFIEDMASEYYGDTYHLIAKNCNHFTDDMAHRLIGKQIPGWVNRLARVASLCSCVLPESLQATTVKQPPKYHECLDGIESMEGDQYREYNEIEDVNSEKIMLLSPKVGNIDIAFIKDTNHRR